MSSLVRDAIFWIAVVSCAVAQLFIMRAVFKQPLVPASHPDLNSNSNSEPARLVPQPRRASELAWALLPALFLALLFTGAWRSMHRAVVTSVPVQSAPSAGVATLP